MGRPVAFADNARKWARQQGAPVTIGIIAVLVVSFLIAWFTQGAPFPYLAMVPTQVLPWTLLTYPFADTGDGRGLFWFLILLLWLYWVGSSLEREIGEKKFAILFAAMTLIPAVLVGFGSLALGKPLALAGANLPISGLTVAWGVHNASSVIRLYGIIPLTGKILAILTVALVLFGYGTGNPLVGVLAVGHLGLAFLFATNRLPFFTYSKPLYNYKPSKEKLQQENQFYDDVRRREEERNERERLRRLFEKSGLDDPEK